MNLPPPKKKGTCSTNCYITFFPRFQSSITSTPAFLQTADGAAKEVPPLTCSSLAVLSSPLSTCFIVFSAVYFPPFHLDFDVYWTLIPHARGRNRETVRLGNFMIISLKNIIYWLYRTCNFIDPLLIWNYRLKNKILLDFHYYQLTHSIPLFLDKWSINDTLFTYNNDKVTWLI